ncbi:MAG: molecular chaperone [Sphingomonadales bacterium BRH_c42]|nr:MAG: molecular chaperone [Sphingomonadales bacterium BRH_c42]
MKRFYREVTLTEVGAGWQVALDSRGIRTATGAPQIVPTQALAAALASEWEQQGDEIDPARFILRDMADFAIEQVAPDPAAAIATLLRYAETDTLCYRADPVLRQAQDDRALYARQQAEWEPLLRAIEAREGIRFRRVSGVMPRPQPAETLEHLHTRLDSFDAFTLAGMQAAAALAASLCIALEATQPTCDPQHLWQLASLEEVWQAEQWGREPMAEERRTRRGESFLAACRFIRLAGQ